MGPLVPAKPKKICTSVENLLSQCIAVARRVPIQYFYLLIVEEGLVTADIHPTKGVVEHS